jgi:GT2 family glycosyltransferase/glycosyltransferase involved in cell wall biosynthesis
VDIASLDMKDALALSRGLATSEGHIGALVELSKLALDRGDTDEALRFTDRAVRLAKDNYHLHILRGTALLKASQPQQAIGHFAQAIAVGGSPNGEIGLIYAHLTLGDIQAANDLAYSLMGRFSCEDYPMIAPLLERVCKSGGKAGAGWVSITADGRLVGALNQDQLTKSASLIAVGISSGRILLKKTSKQLASRATPSRNTEGFIDFKLKPKIADYSEAIHVSINGVELLGSPACVPSASQIEGFVDRVGDRITGWVVLAGFPRARLKIRLIDPQGVTAEFPTETSLTKKDDDAGSSTDTVGRQSFSIDLALIGLAGSQIEVWGWLPALSAGNQLSGSPLGGETRRELNRPGTRPKTDKRSQRASRKRPVDIIVPVYNGRDETLACLDAVIATRRLFGRAISDCEIVVINDGSDDDDLLAALTALASAGEISLLHNDRNLGFPISVNRGFDLHPDRDVVVLNSDAIVFSDWLPRLQAAAYSAQDIGTVTPFSNEASILSYPRGMGDNPAPSAADGAMLDRIASEINAGLTVDIPTAVGFCMYIRRDCLDAVGVFDVTAFGRGYGEENDLCMRAFDAGWRNIAAPNIFVTHIGGRSFRASKKMLVVRNTSILNMLHPGYDGLVRDFIEADPLAAARRNIDLVRLRCAAPGPLILLVTLGLSGGVARHVQDAAERYAARGLKTLILRPMDDDYREKGRAVLSDPFDDTLCNLIFDLPDELDVLLGLLSARDIGKVEIHHFLGLDSSIFTIADRLRVPYDVVLHDYSWLCPRINLVDGRGQYCGLPQDSRVCERCTAIDGAALEEDIRVQDLRQRSARVLAGARRVIAACDDVVDRFCLFAPKAAYETTPWEEEVTLGAAFRRRPDERIRVAVIGGIGEQKGYDVLLACARDAAIRDLPIEFVVIGYTSDDFRLFKTGRVFVTGRYDDAEAIDLIRAQSCHFAFLPSVSPETWSYTLSLAWQAGLEVLAFDFGAIAERIRRAGHGQLIPFSTDAKGINLAISNFDNSLMSASDEAQAEGEVGTLDVPHPGNAADVVVSREISSAPRTQITVHVQNRGDLPFVGPGWAGCVGERLWIEAFTINPLEGFLPEDIEYKALTGTGFETPWCSGGTVCGTRGASNPLIGFAIRLRGPAAERYECRYRGSFLASGIVGPSRNGGPCKSPRGRDPLEGIELEIIERTEAVSLDDQGMLEASIPEYEIVYGSY